MLYETYYTSVDDTQQQVSFIDYFSVLYYTNGVSLKLICASLNVKLCICRNHFM